MSIKARIKNMEVKQEELLAVIQKFSELITRDSDDNGFHYKVIDIRYQLANQIFKIVNQS